MHSILKVLPLTFVMIAGPQIITAVFLAMSVKWRKNSAAIPGLLVLVLGRRAVEALPAVRDWMNGNSWIVSEAVIALFLGLQINTLVSS